MQAVNLTSSDIHTQNNQHKQAIAPSADIRNVEKTSNKSTEAVNAVRKGDKKAITENQADKKIADKQLKANIAQEKLQDTAASQAITKKITQLEAQKEYTETAPSDGIESPTALEVAVQKQDVLESVKSVKPDGTETYYFPVPVEVLTQLPPPGNLGLSAKMLDDIMKKSLETPKNDGDTIKVDINHNNVKKIYLENTQTAKHQHKQDTEHIKSNTIEKSVKLALDYGFG